MATVNTTLQLSQLVSDVANVSSANTTQDLLMLSLAINEATNNTQIFVANTDALPNIVSSNVSDGQIYFVNDIKTLVIAGNKKWMGLDGRVLRCDGEPNIFADFYITGWNNWGQIGDNTMENRCSPVIVSGLINDWKYISIGSASSAAIRTNGTLWMWGFGCRGVLGDNSTVAKSSPISVIGGFTDWCQVSVGGATTSAIRTNGSLWAWGCAACGILGDNSLVDKSSPVSVVGGFTDWCQVSAGNLTMAAVRQNGTLWMWGVGQCGRLGDGTTTNKSSPVSVIGGFTDWCQASTDQCHTLAVRQNGTLWAWGLGTNGRLGDNTTVNKSSPVSVVGGFTDWCQVATGCRHSAAVRQNGTLWSWGDGSSGKLGNNSTTDRSSPVSAVGGFTDWCQVESAYAHTIGLRTNGTAWSWGCGGYSSLSGNLGDGTTTDKSSPVSVVGGISWSKITSGAGSSGLLRTY